jgi:hypothetical protein
MNPTNQSAITRIISSRKGIGAIVVGALGLLAALAVTVSYFQGKMTTADYFAHLEKIGGGITAAIAIAMWGYTQEDIAKATAASTAIHVTNVAPSTPPPPNPPADPS